MKELVLYPIPESLEIDCKHSLNKETNGYISVCDREFAKAVITAKKSGNIPYSVVIGARNKPPFISVERDPSLDTEAYRIIADGSGITVLASTPAGEFYAFKTLKQILKQSQIKIPYFKI